MNIFSVFIITVLLLVTLSLFTTTTRSNPADLKPTNRPTATTTPTDSPIEGKTVNQQIPCIACTKTYQQDTTVTLSSYLIKKEENKTYLSFMVKQKRGDLYFTANISLKSYLDAYPIMSNLTASINNTPIAIHVKVMHLVTTSFDFTARTGVNYDIILEFCAGSGETEASSCQYHTLFRSKITF